MYDDDDDDDVPFSWQVPELLLFDLQSLELFV